MTDSCSYHLKKGDSVQWSEGNRQYDIFCGTDRLWKSRTFGIILDSHWMKPHGEKKARPVRHKILWQNGDVTWDSIVEIESLP